MHKHYTVHLAKGSRPPRAPAEHCFLDQELGQQKGRSSVSGGQVLCREEVGGSLSRATGGRSTSTLHRVSAGPSGSPGDSPTKKQFPACLGACSSMWGGLGMGVRVPH